MRSALACLPVPRRFGRNACIERIERRNHDRDVARIERCALRVTRGDRGCGPPTADRPAPRRSATTTYDARYRCRALYRVSSREPPCTEQIVRESETLARTRGPSSPYAAGAFAAGARPTTHRAHTRRRRAPPSCPRSSPRRRPIVTNAAVSKPRSYDCPAHIARLGAVQRARHRRNAFRRRGVAVA